MDYFQGNSELGANTNEDDFNYNLAAWQSSQGTAQSTQPNQIDAIFPVGSRTWNFECICDS